MEEERWGKRRAGCEENKTTERVTDINLIVISINIEREFKTPEKKSER